MVLEYYTLGIHICQGNKARELGLEEDTMSCKEGEDNQTPALTDVKKKVEHFCDSGALQQINGPHVEHLMYLLLLSLIILVL